jgi:hypothetical protein
MTLSQAMDTFSNYSPQEKIDFLVHFAHTLTILARDTYEVGGEGADPAITPTPYE